MRVLMSSPFDAAVFRGPVVVTALYFGLWYYLLLSLQRGTKYALQAEYAARGEVFDRYFGQDGRMLAADRAVANTHEQMVPFLLSMWLHAVFVSVSCVRRLIAITQTAASRSPVPRHPDRRFRRIAITFPQAE